MHLGQVDHKRTDQIMHPVTDFRTSEKLIVTRTITWWVPILWWEHQ